MSTFNWKKLYDVGKHLDNYSKEEEYQRSVIGRYYYSCFGPVKKYYEQSFRRTLPSKDAHNVLINSLAQSPFIEEQELEDKLYDLRNNRNFADYIPKKIKRKYGY